MVYMEPVAEPLGDASAPVASWAIALRHLEASDSYWLATVRPDGRPHMMPLLVVWLDGLAYFCSSATTRKARNLAENPDCVIGAGTGTLHLVIEGRAEQVRDALALQRIAEAYATRYQWHVTVRDHAFYAEGAPSAGPPPYDVYTLIPTTAFGFGTNGSFGPTRWRFARQEPEV